MKEKKSAALRILKKKPKRKAKMRKKTATRKTKTLKLKEFKPEETDTETSGKNMERTLNSESSRIQPIDKN